MRGALVMLLVAIAIVAPAGTFAQERTYTVDELAVRCMAADPLIVDACLTMLYTVMAPEAGRTPPEPGLGPDGVAFSGTTGQTTPPFELTGGDYRVSWSATAADSGCYIGASLEDTSQDYLAEARISAVVENGETREGETFVYALAPGRYYFDTVNNTCSWSLSIAPI